ncbi:IS66 family insertion sequence element accessory protein TnpB [Thermotalea metallivorans]|uniref:IS66 family insertion sequence element accessory protein TnpB n=1 Tax=Thermotalea metallivorans TaxID=520762 RepID=UPI0018DB89EE
MLWDNNGFWIHYKRLECGSFQCPPREESVSISEGQFQWLFDDLNIEQESAYKPASQRV